MNARKFLESASSMLLKNCVIFLFVNILHHIELGNSKLYFQPYFSNKTTLVTT
jgi:hypothetical protein